MAFHCVTSMATKQMCCCGTVQPNRKGMPQDLGPNRMTRGELQVRTRGDLTAIRWRDKRDARILTNIHDPPSKGNFCDNNSKAIKPQIVADYNRHMGYVDKGDRRQILILSTVSHGSGQSNSSSICLTWTF